MAPPAIRQELHAVNHSWLVIERLPVVSRGKKKRVTTEEKEQPRQALELVLTEYLRPRPLLQLIKPEKLGV